MLDHALAVHVRMDLMVSVFLLMSCHILSYARGNDMQGRQMQVHFSGCQSLCAHAYWGVQSVLGMIASSW